MGWLAALGLAALVYRLVVNRGRLLLQVEALEARLGDRHEIPDSEQVLAAGLPVGSPAPDFALPDLAGNERPLEAWRGSRLLLIFFDPDCSFCLELLPALASLPGAPVPVIVATGGHERIRALAAEHDLSCTVLLQDQTEVSHLFRVPGTPAAYLVDEGGLVAAPLTLGAEAVIELAGGRETKGDASSVTRLPLRPLADSRLLRTGLEAGAHAPLFELPTVSGGTLSLADYRGRRVLLVFLDPACVPCETLAPKLEQLHRQRDDFDLLVISRGDPAANRAKIEEHGLSFPIALQRHWDTSRDYGMFAVPIGYLIDEEGIVVSGVAVGTEPILELAAVEEEVSRAQA